MIRLAVRCAPQQAELVLAELTVLAPGGVEERSGPGYVEYAIYGGEGELPELGELEVTVGDSLVEVIATEVADDWVDRWQEFHKPVMVGERIWLRPSWESPARTALRSWSIRAGLSAPAPTRDDSSLPRVAARVGRGRRGGRAFDGSGHGLRGAGYIAAAQAGLGASMWLRPRPNGTAGAASNAAANDVNIELEQANLREGLPALPRRPSRPDRSDPACGWRSARARQRSECPDLLGPAAVRPRRGRGRLRPSRARRVRAPLRWRLGCPAPPPSLTRCFDRCWRRKLTRATSSRCSCTCWR